MPCGSPIHLLSSALALGNRRAIQTKWPSKNRAVQSGNGREYSDFGIHNVLEIKSIVGYGV